MLNIHSRQVCRHSILLLLVGVLHLGFAVSTSTAAEAELVGLLALVTEEPVAKQLDLTKEQVDKLYDLLDDREAVALSMARQVRDLSADERMEKLKTLRVESQRQMAALLSDNQIGKLSDIVANTNNPFYEPIGPAAAAPVTEEAEPANTESESAEDREEPTANENTDSVADSSDPMPSEPSEAEAEGSPEAGSDKPNDTDSVADGEPTNEEPSDEESTETAETVEAEPPVPSDGKMSFNFRYQPWQDVLDWFAEQNELSLLLESPPSGTFNYTDPRRYTPAEALDVLNSVLLTKGFTLVRRNRMLVLVNLEDGVPPNLVTDVPLDELDERGEYELIRVLFQVRNMTPEAASEEVSRLIGPQGKVVVLPRAGMLQVTETAGRIRAIRSVIQAIEQPESSKLGAIKPYKLQYATASNLLPVLRQMLGIPEEAFSTPEGTLQLAIDNSSADRILAYGTPEMTRRLEEVLKLVDVPDAAMGPIDSLQLEVYPVDKADPEAALLVLQTLLAEEPGTRLAVDPQTGSLVALATLANHATIRATLTQMQEDARQIQVIPLSTVDPQLAILSISKLFGITAGEEVDPRAPIVDADLSTSSLLVRGTKSQIEQIRELLNQMGESGEASYAAGERGNIRMIPLTATEARSALDQLEAIWPSLRPNPIRMVTPANAIRSYRPAEQASPDDNLESEIDSMFRFGDPTEPALPPTDRGTERRSRSKFQFVAFGDEESENEEPAAEVTTTEAAKPKSNAPILVAPGPNGLIIASDDLDALDTFERILEATTTQISAGREYAVFYLKHAKAATAASILGEIFGTSAESGDLIGGIMDNALGDIGGGLMGDLLGLGGGGGTASGFSAAGVDIVTDTRLNAIIVYARPDDIDMVFRLLQVLDQRIGPTEIQAEGVPRLIPVINTSAAEVAEVVKQIYASRLEGGGNGRQPSPEELIRALRNNAGGGGSDNQEPSKMSVGVDERSNSLIVKAEDSLFLEVKALVEQLDTVQLDSTESTQVISLKYSNSEAVREALTSILGEEAVSTTQQNGSNNNSNRNNSSNADAARQQQEMIRRIQEFRSRMQGAGGGGRGPGGGGRPGGGGGGRPGGGGRGGR